MTVSPEDREPSEGPAHIPEDPLSAARRYARPDEDAWRDDASTVPKSGMGRASTSRPPDTSDELSALTHRSKAARTLAIVGIALWFFPCTLGCVASIVLGVISQRKAQETGEPDLLSRIAWIGGAVFTVAEVLVFFMYRSRGTP